MSGPEQLAWGTLLLPLLAAACVTLFALRRPAMSAILSIGAASGVFVLSVGLFASLHGAPPREVAVTWLSVGGLEIELGLRLDALSLLMLLVVTGVSLTIHVFSLGYMRGDRSAGRYFAGLSLFLFAMLAIVLANNFLFLFIGWELVGVSSYLLIGFWYDRPAAADASKKAFLVNRLGDFGFFAGLLVVWTAMGTLDFGELEGKLAANPQSLGGLTSVAGLLIFCGVLGKSAQFPLHVWLPDAMEGPTPVSALIHAATMVAAGVYLLCRVFFLLALPGSIALEVIAWVGAFTALLAALISIQQNDIKRILAYSTLSQLGYMVMAVGVSGAARSPVPAMYHLTTHACFKALLFLGAGSVIVALHHQQDIWRMGGLRRRMPLTFVTFLVAALALCGLPPFSGFFSKDAILAAALSADVGGRSVLFGAGVLVAGLTGFYMTRLVVVVFGGASRTQAADHARESPWILTVPLLVLAVPSALSGFWGIDVAYARQFGVSHPADTGGIVARLTGTFAHAPAAAFGGLATALVGIGAAAVCYWRAPQDGLSKWLGAVGRWMRDRFYIDEAQAALNSWTQERLAWLADVIDRWVIGGAMVRGAHGAVSLAGRLLRLTQTGNPRTHAVLFAAGVAVVVLIVLVR